MDRSYEDSTRGGVMADGPYAASSRHDVLNKIAGKNSSDLDAETIRELNSFIGAGSYNEFDDSVAFDVASQSEDERVLEAVEWILPQVTGVTPTKIKQAVARTHLNSLLLNIYRAHSIFSNCYLAYPRRNGSLVIPSRYNPLKITSGSLKTQVDGLNELGYVECKRGFKDMVTHAGRVSRVRAKACLIDTLNDQFKFSKELATNQATLEPIRLIGENGKGALGKLLDYEDTSETNGMRDRIRAYNNQLLHSDIRLSGQGWDVYNSCPRPQQIDFSRVQVHRIFNRGSFTCLGRFYGPWWQAIKNRPAKDRSSPSKLLWPGEVRKHILINEEPTVECDYSAMHIHLLYCVEGMNYHEIFDDGDPYLIDSGNPEDRKIVKQIVLTAINAKSEEEGLEAVRKKLWSEEMIDLDIQGLKKYLGLISRKHHRISDYLYSDAGIHLQNLDSKIADFVITGMAKRGIVALPIHDSFIVQDRYCEELVRVMWDAFDEFEYVSKPVIKAKGLWINGEFHPGQRRK